MPDRTTPTGAAEVAVRDQRRAQLDRVDQATRVDRIASAIGYRSPELAAATVGAAVGATVFPPAFLVTVLALGWIPAEKILTRRSLRAARRQAAAQQATAQQDQDTDDTPEVQTA